ncbi:MAG: sugar phosphate nucleotidyltransferase [Microscillaceae bacterium]|nr:sugar phosphate nucleotidyltransferase [Microscillaceae bacterium]MDW8460747.1 sugar phosphate nucleotidyltransferase [Cytophagales bacterium]
MKVIIPVAGVGSRLRPHTHTQPKTLVPIAGKPILAHIVDELVAWGFQEFIFVVGYLGDKIERYVQESYPNIQKKFVVQEPRQGIAHAVWLCRALFQPNEPALIVLGDTIASVDLKFMQQNEHTILAVKKVARPETFGIAELDEQGYIKKLVEKPRIPKSNLALVGIYKIKDTTHLFSAIEQMLERNIRSYDEYQLTDALMLMIEQGAKMQTIQVHNWFDCGKKETLLEANAILLRTRHKQNKFPPYPQTIIIPPVCIGKNCAIQNAIIGPNVAIGDNSGIRHSVIENTIIGSYSDLSDVILKNSIIGNDTSIKGVVQSLNVGDSTEINFGKDNF